jgi:hypothetical protein
MLPYRPQDAGNDLREGAMKHMSRWKYIALLGWLLVIAGPAMLLWGPRIIATDRQAPRIYPRMIRLCSRFDSVLFTPKMSEIPSYGNYSRSP